MIQTIFYFFILLILLQHPILSEGFLPVEQAKISDDSTLRLSFFYQMNHYLDSICFQFKNLPADCQVINIGNCKSCRSKKWQLLLLCPQCCSDQIKFKAFAYSPENKFLDSIFINLKL